MPDSKLWSDTPVTGPSAGLVQQHYLRIRLQELTRRGPEYEALILDKLRSLLENVHKQSRFDRLRGKDDGWTKAYKKINENMQKSDLTINFQADNFFGGENHSASYAQMYERAGTRSDAYVLHTKGMDSAKVRANVDDAITFPENWKAQTKAPVHRIMQPVGLAPGRGATRDRVRNQMAFDGTDAAVQGRGNAGTNNASQVPAKFFNPKTKQIFAGLNYGRRPHGSTTAYGHSYFVLADKLKINAIYYPKDTFAYAGPDASNGIKQQFPFTHLAAVIAFNMLMAPRIIDSCLNGMVLSDSSSEMELLEAHIHGALPFAGNLKKIVVCTKFEEARTNAKKFALKWGAELELRDVPRAD